MFGRLAEQVFFAQSWATSWRNDIVAAKQWSKPFDFSVSGSTKYGATLTTNKGSFDVELFVDKAPQTVNNFVNLAREGYYDGTPRFTGSSRGS